MRLAIALLAGLCLANFANADASPDRQWLRERIAHMTPVKGAYRNSQYGFTVPALPGIHAYRAAAPAPNHGVLYVLGDHRTITVSAEFDAADYGSTKAQLDHILAGMSAGSVDRSAITLDGRPAEQTVFRAGDAVTKVVAQRRDERDGILYELDLTTTPGNQAEDWALFDKVIAGFKSKPLLR
jgi:hypothetical protein